MKKIVKVKNIDTNETFNLDLVYEKIPNKKQFKDMLREQNPDFFKLHKDSNITVDMVDLWSYSFAWRYKLFTQYRHFINISATTLIAVMLSIAGFSIGKFNERKQKENAKQRIEKANEYVRQKYDFLYTAEYNKAKRELDSTKNANLEYVAEVKKILETRRNRDFNSDSRFSDWKKNPTLIRSFYNELTFDQKQMIKNLRIKIFGSERGFDIVKDLTNFDKLSDEYSNEIEKTGIDFKAHVNNVLYEENLKIWEQEQQRCNEIDSIVGNKNFSSYVDDTEIFHCAFTLASIAEREMNCVRDSLKREADKLFR